MEKAKSKSKTGSKSRSIENKLNQAKIGINNTLRI